MRTTAILAIVVALAHGIVQAAPEREEQIPSTADGWPLILLQEPYHIGDDPMKSFASVEPQGNEIVRKFQIDGPFTPSLYVAVWVSDLVPRDHGTYKQGHYQTRLKVNGKTIAVLNKKIRGTKDTPEIRKLVYRVEQRYFKKGVNEIRIKGGAHATNYDDFQVHGIVVDRSPPRKLPEPEE